MEGFPDLIQLQAILISTGFRGINFAGWKR